MITSTLVVGSTTIPYTITSSSRRKTILIRVKPPGTLEVKAPMTVDTIEIVRTVQLKSIWILDKIMTMQTYSLSKPVRMYAAGETFLYLGRQYRLVIEKGTTTSVRLRGSHLVVNVPQNRISSPINTWVKDRLFLWYRTRAQEVIGERIRYWSKRLNISTPTFSIKHQKQRWGSCSSKNNISINVRILMAPRSLIDYVVLHELCHIIHKNHSSQFWDMVRLNMPDYAIRKEELNKNGWKFTF